MFHSFLSDFGQNTHDHLQASALLSRFAVAKSIHTGSISSRSPVVSTQPIVLEELSCDYSSGSILVMPELDSLFILGLGSSSTFEDLQRQLRTPVDTAITIR